MLSTLSEPIARPRARGGFKQRLKRAHLEAQVLPARRQPGTTSAELNLLDWADGRLSSVGFRKKMRAVLCDQRPGPCVYCPWQDQCLALRIGSAPPHTDTGPFLFVKD